MTTSVKFNLKLESLNDAFQNGNHAHEIARLLKGVVEAVEKGAEGRFHLYDTNGNCVGSAFLEVWEG